MLLIWGVRVRSKTLSETNFHCPSCGGDRRCSHKQARRWFTLFFIPLIPLKVLGEFVECQTCKKGFDTGILALPTSAALTEQMLGAMREAVVQLLRIDGSATAREAACRALSEMAGRLWSEEELDADLQHLDVAPLPARLHQLAEVMNDDVFVRSVDFVDPDGILLEFAASTRAFTPDDVRHAPVSATTA